MRKLGGSPLEYPIKNFLGLNLRDSADRVQDNEFVKLQNVWQPTKGVLARRFGSVSDVSSIPLASKISGVWRHYGINQENFSIYHCEPDSTQFPDNTADLVLTDVTSAAGKIFGGGAVVTLRVCYSWIGCGLEQTYNSKNRVGFPAAGSFPLDAWNNPGHQSITLGASTNKLQVTIPAFPTGVVGANIFLARGTATEMCYMGTITTSAGSLTIDSFIGPTAASADGGLSQGVSAYQDDNGLLSTGIYWVSLAWVVNNGILEGDVASSQTSALNSLFSGKTLPSTTLGVSVAASAVSGSLSNTTNYDSVVSIVDPNGKENYVSTVLTGATGAGTSLDFSLPSLPSEADPKSTFNLYFGSSGGTLYLSKTGQLPNSLVNIGVLPVNGKINPGPKFPNNQLAYAQQMPLTGTQNAIRVKAPSSNSSNGAKSLYVFIGTQSPTVQPMVCAGIINVGNGTDAGTFINLLSIPHHNAQSYPFPSGADKFPPVFCNEVNSNEVGGVNLNIGSRVLARFGFLKAKKEGGAIYEIFPSRTLARYVFVFIQIQLFQGDVNQSAFIGQTDLHNLAPSIRTPNDLYKSVNSVGSYLQPYVYEQTVIEPQFTYHLGVSYFSNGLDIPWQTDGYTLGQLSKVNGTVLPPIPRYIFEYQNSLVIAGALAGNQLYQSNASAPQNWSTGGTGSLLRFVTIGDATGSGVTATGIFTPQTEATNNPGSFMIAFKKNGTWMISSVPDPSSSGIAGTQLFQIPATMIQISGRTGCVAYRSIVQTPLGTLFLAQDGNVYLINRVAEPQKIGTKIQNALSHLVGHDDWMQKCTAVFHENHYKLSYPSSSAVLLDPVVNDSELWADLRTEGRSPITWVGPHAGRNIGSQVVLVGDADNLSRLAADDSQVRSMTLDSTSTFTDLGSSISAKILSKIYRFGAEAHFKRYLGAILDVYIDSAFTNSILFEGFADADYQQVNRLLSSGGGVWNSSLWDQANYADAAWQGFSFLFGGTNLNGRTFQWQISSSDQAPFVLASTTLLLKSERRNILL